MTPALEAALWALVRAVQQRDEHGQYRQEIQAIRTAAREHGDSVLGAKPTDPEHPDTPKQPPF